jgi:7-cyano-7-deazaguanine synthase in queuosine biosynthesis
MKKKVVILYSGGLDSFAMRQMATYKDTDYIYLYFDIGQEYALKEMAVLPADVIIRTVDWLGYGLNELKGKEGSSSGNIFIPGRNGTLASLAASIYTPDEIWMGALLGETHDGSTDKNYEFLKRINHLFAYMYRDFERTPVVRFPLADAGMDKWNVVDYLLGEGITPKEIMATSSCLSGTLTPCGHCVVCCRRRGIFSQFGFNEQYLIEPFLARDNFKMLSEMLMFEIGEINECHYDAHRRNEIVPTLVDFWEGDVKKALEFYNQ